METTIKATTKTTIKATHIGTWEFNGIKINCANLPDGTRVISERGMLAALNIPFSGSRYSKKNNNDTNKPAVKFPVFLGINSLKPFVINNLNLLSFEPIEYYDIRSGKKAHGIDATLLPDICGVWVSANEAGVLTERQQQTANKALHLLMAFAKTGITALVDEVTGYQEDRKKRELQLIIQSYINEIPASWKKRFPDHFFHNLYRVYSMKRDPKKKNHPQFMAQFIKKYIYDQLPKGIYDKLAELNPADESGNRKNRHHQHLTDNCGLKHLENQINEINILLKASQDEYDFKRNFMNYQGKCYQGYFPF